MFLQILKQALLKCAFVQVCNSLCKIRGLLAEFHWCLEQFR